MRRILIIIFLNCLTKAVIGQDSSLIKINFNFTVDDYNMFNNKYIGDKEAAFDSKFCYTTKGGLRINHYFTKRKNIGLALIVNGGYKRICFLDDYRRYISYNKYDISENYKIKMNYWLLNSQLRFAYLINNIVEPFIGIGVSRYGLINKNFESNTGSIATIGHEYKYMTYFVTEKFDTRQVFWGANFILKKISLGLHVNIEWDNSLSDYGIYSGYKASIHTSQIGCVLDLAYNIF